MQLLCKILYFLTKIPWNLSRLLLQPCRRKSRIGVSPRPEDLVLDGMITEDIFVHGTRVPTEAYHLGPRGRGDSRAHTAGTNTRTAADEEGSSDSPPMPVPSHAARSWHTFFVPGNPGCLFYYLPWLHDTHAMLVQQAERTFGVGQMDVYVHGLSHANHHFSQPGEDDGPPPASVPASYGLQFQIAHAEAFVFAALGQPHDCTGTGMYTCVTFMRCVYDGFGTSHMAYPP